MSKKEFAFIALSLVVVGIASRLLPHPWNMTPVTAIAMLSSAYLGLRSSFVIFLSTMVLTDVILGLYQWEMMLAVYGSFFLASLAGLAVRKSMVAGSVIAGALSSSLVFFLITNWAVWQFGTMYPHSAQGLMQSYVMALPFFKNALIGDVFYSLTLFGSFELARRSVFGKRRVPAPVGVV